MHTVFDILGKYNYKHLYIYSIGSIMPEPHELYEIEPFADWENVPVKTMHIQSADYYFIAMRKNPECVAVNFKGQIDGDFGLNVRIRSPEKEPSNLAPLLKPVLDGIISSFHKLPENTNIDELTDKGIRLLNSNEDWKRWLRDERKAVLPPYQYVKQYRSDRLQWSPMDERCKEARLTVEYGADNWSFSGEIYKVTIAD